MSDRIVAKARHALAFRRWLRKGSQRAWTEYVRVCCEVYG